MQKEMTTDDINAFRELVIDAVEADKAASEAKEGDEDILIHDANESEERLGAFVREHSAFILAAVEGREVKS